MCKSSEGFVRGADNLDGGPGNDILVYGSAWTIRSDGHKDFLHCGSGVDLAFLNITIDHDEAKNCEFINDENAPVT
ncbi:MAG: hypothetical protein ACP5OH_01715 [Nitrososphaerota archaeon]